MLSTEKTPWGVRLLLLPFGDREEIKIVGEIERPEGDKKPDVRFWIDATPKQKPLRMTDMTVLQQGLHNFMDAVKDEAAQMTNLKRKPKKK